MRTSLLGFCLVISFSIVTGFAASTYKGPELDSLPSAVQRAIKDQARGCKLACIEESTDDGEMVYNVEVRKGERERSFSLREDGTLSRSQIFLDDAPAAVRRKIQEELGNGTLSQIDKYPSEDESTYEVEMTKDGHDRAFSVAEDGRLLNIEVFLEELPSAVRKTIQKQLGSGRLGGITKVLEDGETTYEVSMTRHRRDLPFCVSSEGHILNAVVLLEDTPAPVRKAIRKALGDAYLEEINAFTEDGKTTYSVTVTRGDETETFEVTADGKVLESDDSPEKASKLRV